VGERGGGESGPAAASWAGRGGGPAEKAEEGAGPRGLERKGGRERVWRVFFSSFFNHSSTFQTFEIKLLFKFFKIQTIFQNFQINLKAFKASHQQTKKPHAFKS
jgi:hypothetical protein